MSKILDVLYNSLFPSEIKCIVCGKDLQKDEIMDICPDCLKSIKFNNGKRCLRCGKNLWAGSVYCNSCKKSVRFFKNASAPLLYEKPISSMIRRFKYDGKHYLAKPFAKILTYEYAQSKYEVDLVLPIPMFYKREKERGYNHAKLLAKEFCKLTSLPLDTKNFVRIINTNQQAKLSKDEREKNMHNAFRVIDSGLVKNKKILLIDDIITTGATIDECARVLYECGASEVNALAIAHTPSRLYIFNKNNSLKGTKSFDKMTKIMYNTQAKANKDKSTPFFRK